MFVQVPIFPFSLIRIVYSRHCFQTFSHALSISLPLFLCFLLFFYSYFLTSDILNIFKSQFVAVLIFSLPTFYDTISYYCSPHLQFFIVFGIIPCFMLDVCLFLYDINFLMRNRNSDGTNFVINCRFSFDSFVSKLCALSFLFLHTYDVHCTFKILKYLIN